MAGKAVGVKEASTKSWKTSLQHLKTLFKKPLRQVSHFGLVAVILVVLLSGVPAPKSLQKAGEVPVDPFGMVRSTMAPEEEIDLTELEILAMATSFIDPEMANQVYEEISSNENEAQIILAGNTIANAATIDTESSAAIKNKFTDYIVQGGDTLSVIASKFGVTTNSIKWSNAGIANINSIKPGTALKIPTVTGIVYTVKRGDSVELIASKYKSNATQIVAYNDLYGESLKAGMTILVPNGTVTEAAPAPTRATVAASSGSAGRYGSNSYIASTGNLRFPTIIGRNGYYNGYHWWAIDIPNSIGTPIFAADSGRIVEASYGWNGGYGNTILIDHGNGMQTRYAHMTTLLIRGGYVSKGQTIGRMGSTGRSTGSHLHFEVIIRGTKVNPTRYF